MNIRPMTQAEQKYTFQQSQQISGQCGNIGYLRGDFARSGKEFHSTWFEQSQRLKTDAFKAEFDTIINALRSDEYGLLKDRSTMIDYAGRYPDSAIKQRYNTEYGFRVDTEQHAYLIRCNPIQGDYNFYCFCYVAQFLNHHMDKAEKGIQFITPDYKERFRIPDGEKIIVKDAVGGKGEYTCRYIDEAHVEVDRNLFHICEFAERMEKSGCTYEPKASEPLHPTKAPAPKDNER